LVIIIMLGALLALFATVLTRMLVRESANIVATKRNDSVFAAGDSGVQRSISTVLANPTYWANPSLAAGYQSISGSSAVGFKDPSGVTYYMRITPGAMVDVSNTGAATDAAINTWVNKGDKDHDRTIWVRTVDPKGKEDRFYTVIHRSSSSYQFGDNGIVTGGDMSLAGWHGNAYNSCTDPIPTPPAGDTSGATLLAGGNISGGGGSFGGFGQSSNGSVNLGTLAPPVGAIAIPGLSGGTGGTIGGAISMGPASNMNGIDYQAAGISMNGNNLITVDISKGPVRLWITGSISFGGNTGITTTGTYPGCCQAKGFTLYATGSDSCPTDCSNCHSPLVSWNGTPSGKWMLVAPQGSLYISGAGGGAFEGAIAAKSVCISGGGSGWFVYDKCLAVRPPVNNYKNPPVITMTWKQIGLKPQVTP
jgi:hypothetical protein